MGYSGAGGKLIHEKTRSKKSRDTVPLKALSNEKEERNGFGNPCAGQCYFLSRAIFSIHVSVSNL